jgi:hypothetical protein
MIDALRELHATYADAAGNVVLRHQTEVILGDLPRT